MLVRRMALVLLLGVGTVPLAVEACSSSDSSGPVADAGDEEAADVGPPDSATCDLGANLLDQIPDAEIPDSSTTTGICLGCVSTKCGTTVAQCNASCPCQSAVASGLQCYVKNSANPLACVLQFQSSGADPTVTGIGLTLVNCVKSDCPTECGQKAAGSDAG
jgi:hypothetical protein